MAHCACRLELAVKGRAKLDTVASMVCPSGRSRDAAPPAKELHTGQEYGARVKQGAKLHSLDHSSWTPPLSKVHHDTEVLDLQWAAEEVAAMRP